MKRILIDKNKKIDCDLLSSYGFSKSDDVYLYSKNILNNDFRVEIKVDRDNITSRVMDNDTDFEYTLVDTAKEGNFLGTVKDSYELVIKNFLDKCTTVDLNYNNQVNEVIKYINNKYKDDIEYLWDTSPNSGIFRNKINSKWYAALLEVKENRVGGTTDKEIMVIDLMYYKDKTSSVIDNKKIYPGYHMNKKSWITIRLDNAVDNDFVFKYIDLSYELSINKK